MPAAPTSVKRIDITLPSRLRDRLTALAEYPGLGRTELIRLILTAHVNAKRETTSPSSRRTSNLTTAMTTPESTSVERIIITLPSRTLDALTELAERNGRSPHPESTLSMTAGHGRMQTGRNEQRAGISYLGCGEIPPTRHRKGQSHNLPQFQRGERTVAVATPSGRHQATTCPTASAPSASAGGAEEAIRAHNVNEIS
jgi:hypothetical protein